MSCAVSAATYELNLDEDDSFTWEVTELNHYAFEKTFGFEPDFEEGDQTRRTIREIDEYTDGWTLTVEFWDFDDKFDEDGAIIYDEVFEDPENYEDNIFVPTPVNDYLAELPDVDSSYVVDGLRVTKRGTDYDMIKEYDDRGVLVREEFIDDDEIVLVRIEATFRIIPAAGFQEIIGFTVIALISIIIYMIKKKKFIFS